MKKIISLILALIVILCLILLPSCSSNPTNSTNSNSNTNEDNTKKEGLFYNKVLASQLLLDIVADDIYPYWYDCIYRNTYSGDIDVAILLAQSNNMENINLIKTTTDEIKELYKEIKNNKLGSEAKAVMQAYNEYYDLVINVSGSFTSYSANKETLKRNLNSALDNFLLEIS